MRTASERLLLRLEWRVVRRLDGRLAGGYRTAHRGTGTDLAGLREYVEGDDARYIDWNATARLNKPHLRVFTEDRELTVWLVLDRSASMTVGVPGRSKQDVLSELALVLARLFGRGGNRVGALLYDTAFGNRAVRTVSPGTGRRHALRIGAELARTTDAGRGGAGRGGAGQYGGTTDLAAMLDVIDSADDELPDAGLVVVEDAETGEQLVIDSSDPLLRARLAACVEDRDTSLAAGMRRAGVPIHRIGTDADLATALIDVVASTRRRRA